MHRSYAVLCALIMIISVAPAGAIPHQPSPSDGAAAGGFAGPVPTPTTDEVPVQADAPAWLDESLPTARDLVSVHFFNGTHGWVGAEDGMLFHTTDGGRTWSVTATGLFGALEHMAWPTPQAGWVATEDMGLARTTDGGQTWELLAESNNVADYEDLVFTNTSHGYVSGMNGVKMGFLSVTHDGADTFEPLGLAYENQESRFVDVEPGTGGRLTVLTSLYVDGWGVSVREGPQAGWTFHQIPTSVGGLTDLAAFDDANATVVGAAGQAYHTTDGGQTWSLSTTATRDTLLAAETTGPRSALAVGTNGRVVVTVDGGANWTLEPTRTNAHLHAISTTDDANAWAVGEDGTVLRRASTGAVVETLRDDLSDLSRTPRPPIAVVSNGGFQLPTSGVTGGSGTAEDPYVISGWDIRPTLTDGITISNTDAHVLIRNNTIHDGANGNAAVRLVNAANVTVEDNRIHDNPQGVLVQGGHSVQVADNQLRRVASTGVELSGANDAQVTGNTVSMPGATGVSVALGEHVRVAGNTVELAGQIGIQVRSQAAGSAAPVVEGNRVTGGPTGIDLASGTGARVASNAVLFADNVGLVVSAHEADVLDNRILGSGSEGIRLDGGVRDVRVADNHVEGPWTALWLEDARGSLVEANTLTSKRGEALLATLSQQAEIKDNHFPAPWTAIKLEPGTSQAHIHHNEIVPQSRGLWMTGSDGNEVGPDNTIRAAGTDATGEASLGLAVYLDESEGNTLHGNTIEGARIGISLIDRSRDNRVTDNQLRDVDWVGLEVGMGSNGNRLVGNRVTDAAQEAFRARAVDGVEVQDLTVRGADGPAVLLESAHNVTLSGLDVRDADTGLLSTGNCPSDEVDCDSENNDLVNATFEQIRDAAVRTEREFTGWTHSETRNLTLRNVTVRGAPTGLDLDWAYGLDTEAVGFEDVDVGVQATNATDVDVRETWWGDDSGPGGEGPGEGAAIHTGPETTVLYDPWLTSPP